MSIEAINEQLLRAIGVGVALVDLRDLSLRFRNDIFVEWFGDGEGEVTLGDVFPTLDLDALEAALGGDGRFAAEVSFKVRRRTMTIALDCNRAVDADENIAVLVCQNISRIKELEAMIDSYSMMVERNTLAIRREKEQVEKLLLNIMPRSAYEEYKTFGVVAPWLFEPVSVLALDFAGFDDILASQEAGVVVSELNDIYSAFDRIGEQFGCERIRTGGDCYLSLAGVPDPVGDHAEAIANAAVRFVRYLRQRNESHPVQWNLRIGIASGSVIGSVVGHQKYIYDVFGPAVSRAVALRDAAEAMTVSTDADTAAVLGEASISRCWRRMTAVRRPPVSAGRRPQPAGPDDGGRGRRNVRHAGGPRRRGAHLRPGRSPFRRQRGVSRLTPGLRPFSRQASLGTCCFWRENARRGSRESFAPSCGRSRPSSSTGSTSPVPSRRWSAAAAASDSV